MLLEKIAPHQTTYSTKQKKKSVKQFWAAHDEHQTAGSAYAQTVEAIVNGDALASAGALKAVQKMRSRARSVIAGALADVRAHVGTLVHMLTAKKTKSISSWIHHAWNSIPHLALTSFAKAEELNNTVSEESWNAMLTVQTIGVQTWQSIEQARASFYLAHYREVMSILNTVDRAQKYRAILLDQHGLLPKKHQTQLLPKLEL